MWSARPSICTGATLPASYATVAKGNDCDDNDKTIWQQTWRVWLTRDVDQLRASVQKLTGLRTMLKPTGDEPEARHLVIDSDVPWIPAVNRPSDGAAIYYVDVDPLKSQIQLWHQRALAAV